MTKRTLPPASMSLQSAVAIADRARERMRTLEAGADPDALRALEICEMFASAESELRRYALSILCDEMEQYKRSRKDSAARQRELRARLKKLN